MPRSGHAIPIESHSTDPTAPESSAKLPSAPRVSVVISNYNYERYIGSAILSAINQSHPVDEIVVVDDGSTDGSRAVIQSFLPEPRVKAIFGPNGGQAAAMNVGYSSATGDIIIFLDADDCLKPDAVLTVIDNWEPGISRCQYPLEVIDSDGNILGVHPFAQRMEGGYLHWKLIIGGYFHFVPTSGNAFSRAALDRIFPLPAADWRLCADAYVISLSAAYGPVRCLFEPLGLYRIHGGNNWQREVQDPEHVREIWKNRFRVWRSLIDHIEPPCRDEASARTTRTTRDYAALYLTRRVVIGNLIEGRPLSSAFIRSTIASALFRTIRAKIPWRHKLLYMAFFACAGPAGWRIPAAASWHQHHLLRKPWISGIINRLKGGDFYDWMVQPHKPSAVATIPLATKLEFGARRTASPFLWYGWDQSEPWISWIIGREAALICRLPADHHDLKVTIELFPYLGGVLKQQRVAILANDTLVCERHLSGESSLSFVVPRAVARRTDWFVIKLQCPDAIVPRYFGGRTADYRPLGVACRKLTISNIPVGNATLTGPSAPIARRVCFTELAAAAYLSSGWHVPAGGVAYMAHRQATLQMTLLNGVAFDHFVQVEFEEASDKRLCESKVYITFNGKRQTVVELDQYRSVWVHLPRGSLTPHDGLVLRFETGPLVPGKWRSVLAPAGATGPGVMGFQVRRALVEAHLPLFPLGQTISFAAAKVANRYVAQGWSKADAKGIVSTDAKASLLGLVPIRDREIFVTAIVYPAADAEPLVGQQVQLVCNNRVVARYTVLERSEITAIIPLHAIGEDLIVRLEFQVSALISLSDIGAGADTRRIGVGVEALLLE